MRSTIAKPFGSQWDDKQPAPVGSFKPNAFGLYDMHDNVWEWVEDCWTLQYGGAPNDGSARKSGCPDDTQRVQRGGAFLHEPRVLRSTVRNNYTKNARANGVGFRVARTL
jgi:formylglycine-generating enzyme required for sulfatase activity